MTYTGRCACGQIKATIEGEPLTVRQCWCRQCQKLTGGGPIHNAMFLTEDIALDGELAEHSYVAASGNTIYHGYCVHCGTPVFSRASARPQFRGIRLGFLEGDHGLKPQMAIWTSDAPGWAVIDPALEQWEGQPPPPKTG